MQLDEAYELKLETLQAIPADQVTAPNSIPVKTYISEALDLQRHCLPDRGTLEARMLPATYIDDIEIRAKALGHAEMLWGNQRRARAEANQLWYQQFPDGANMRKLLIREYRYAFDGDEKLMNRVNEIAENQDQMGIITDLHALSLLGKSKTDLLTATGFDLTLLDQAERLCGELYTLRAGARAERKRANDYKDMRDRAYTHLSEAVNAIQRLGKLVFYENKEKSDGYYSTYLRSRGQKSSAEEPTVPVGDQNNDRPIDQDPPVTEPAAESAA